MGIKVSEQVGRLLYRFVVEQLAANKDDYNKWLEEQKNGETPKDIHAE